MAGLIISGSKSNSGKTTITCGILANLKDEVLPFKVGPDYVDPMFHKFITGKASYNLDSYILEEEVLKYLYLKHSKEGKISLIEGVMGLYDGLVGSRENIGSTAHVSKILKLPVILILDAKGISTSIAAQALGYKLYDKVVNLRGVILNNVSGQRHYDILKEAIERDTGLECLGFLPKTEGITFKSRQLGLIPSHELEDLKEKIEKIKELTKKHINLKRIKEIAKEALEIKSDFNLDIEKKENFTLAIAKDKAFNFYYQDNLDLIKESGIKIIEFSPLKDKTLENVDMIYLGGGYPEVFADDLEKNIEMKNIIINNFNKNIPIYAECGGLIYLGKNLEIKDKNYKMLGIFDFKTKMNNRLNIRRFGYINVNYKNQLNIKAHEFHYSDITELNEEMNFAFNISKNNKKKWLCGFNKKNVLAGYPHIHFYSNIEFFKNLFKLNK